MDRARFFELIDAARADVEDTGPSADPDALATVLDPLDADELSAFAQRFDDELIRLNRWDVWAAGYVAAGGMSDDGFHYWRCWLVGKGTAAVETALTDPDGLAAFLDDEGIEEGGFENEGLEYVVLDLLEERDLPDPRLDDGPHADDDPEGERFSEDDVEQRFPRISARVAEAD